MENPKHIEDRAKSLDERVKMLDERLKKSQETIISCSEKIKGIKTELETYSKNAKARYFGKIDKRQIIDANFLDCAEDVIPDFGFGKADWDFYLVERYITEENKEFLSEENRKYVRVAPVKKSQDRWNWAKVRYSEFKNIFPELVKPLEENKRLVIAGEFAIGDKNYPLSKDRKIYFSKNAPRTRIITKNEQREMRKTLEKRIDDDLRQLGENEAKLVEEKKSESLLKNEFGYLNSVLKTAEEKAGIRKGLSGLFGKPCYSAWIGESPVLMYSEGNFYYVASNRKDEPLKINLVTAPAAKAHLKNAVSKAQKELSFKEGNFITYNGMPLIKGNETYAAELFQKIFQGIEILPRPEEPKGYYEKAQQSEGTESEIVYRHWGQIFLSMLSPDEVKQGEVLGSGGSYKSFKFGEKVVVEFDQADRATYLFDTASFDKLRTRNRSELLNENPSGFYGRVIHHENRDLWKDGISKFLK